MSLGFISLNIAKPLRVTDNADGTVSLVTDTQNSTLPFGADAITVTYPDSITDIYSFRSGGTGGTIIKVVTVIYTASSKQNILSVELT